MIHTQALDLTGAKPLERELVDCIEDVGVFDTYPDERGHVEEASVVELVTSDTPARQAVVLLLEHSVERVACRLAGLGHVGAGCDGEPKPPVVDLRLRPGDEFDRAGLEFSPIVATEHGHQHTTCQLAFGRSPIDVEELRVRARRPVAEHRPPAGIDAGVRDRGVVRHDVDHIAETVLREGIVKACERRFATELGVHPAVIDSVVPMRRPGGGLQVRRGVDVADAQFSEVGDHAGCLVQAEVGRQLQSVGRDQWGFGHTRPRTPGAGGADVERA